MSVRLADPTLLAIALMTVAWRFPGHHLKRNEVGNLVICTPASGIMVGWVDLQTGNVLDLNGEVVSP